MKVNETYFFVEGDIRVQKTRLALYNAMFALLIRRNFNAITVHDLCAQAHISRATFYTHFLDKYDLLECMLKDIRQHIIRDLDQFEQLESEINSFIDENKKAISNVLKEANSETLALMRRFMEEIVAMLLRRQEDDKKSPHHIIFFSFCSGGLLNLLTWIVEHNYPSDISMMSGYLYKMLKAMAIWDEEQQ